MKYTYPVEEYAKLYKEYIEMGKLTFSKDDKKEYILNKLEENAKKKLRMAEVSNTMINEYINRFIGHEDEMSEEDANTLQSFLDSFDVQLELLDSGSVDYSVVLLIAKILVKYYQKSGDFPKYLTAVRRVNIGLSVTYLSHGYIFEGENPNYDYVIELENHINDQNGEYKTAIIPAVSNLLYRTTKSYPLDFYQKLKDFIFINSEGLEKADIYKFFYLLRSLEYFREYLIECKKDNISVDINPYKSFLKELCELATKMVDENKLAARNIVSLKQNIAITKYLLGEQSVEQTLLDLDNITKEEESNEHPLLSYNGTTFANHLYLNFLYWFSNYPKEEIKRISQNKIKEALPKVISFTKSTSDFLGNYMTLAFVQAASLTSSFDEFKEIILHATVYSDKALYIHTVMVKEMAGVVFDYIIEHNPSFFNGVMNKDIDYIIDHKEEMKDLLSECCMFHDIGKFYMIDVVENSMRKLTDDEFAVIKKHPAFFSQVYEGLNDDDEKLRCIKDVAYSHHLWHDGSKGYPAGFKHTNNRPFADIVSVVDSIDAATDFLGRPYNAGKTIDQLTQEFLSRAGSQYSSEVCHALLIKEVRDKLQYLITEGRKEVYYKAYTMGI